MKTLYSFLLILWSVVLCASPKEEPDRVQKVKHEIRYTTSEATEIFLVWGLNNWKLPDPSLRPEGSFIKDGFLYSPMKKRPFGFSSELKVPQHSMIDYVFWISQGPAGKPVDIWDKNLAPYKDYHSLAINNKIELVQSKLKIRPVKSLTILDFALPLLGISTLLFFIFMIIRHQRSGNTPLNTSPARLITATAIVLAIDLILIRSSITGQSWDLYLHPFIFFPKIIWAGFYDVMYILLITGVFLSLNHFFRSKPVVTSFLSGSFVLLSFCSFIAGLLNIQLLEITGKPFPYSLFHSQDLSALFSAISDNTSSAYLLQLGMVCFASLCLVHALIVMTDLLVNKFRMKRILVSSLITFCMLYITIAPGAIRTYHWEYTRLANPVIVFAGSARPFFGDPGLSPTMGGMLVSFNMKK